MRRCFWIPDLLLAILFCFKLITVTDGQSNVLEKFGCEKYVIGFGCQAPLVISITQAWYGRDQNTICNGRGKKCVKKLDIGGNGETYDIVSDICNGNYWCSVLVTDRNMGGKPRCGGVSVYLRVRYTCTVPTNLATLHEEKAQFCEGDSFNVACPQNFVINITYGFYGRNTPDINHCWIKPRGLAWKNSCGTDFAYTHLSRVCSGYRRCTMIANNRYFNDPCKGTLKFLVFKFTCVSGNDAIDVWLKNQSAVGYSRRRRRRK